MNIYIFFHILKYLSASIFVVDCSHLFQKLSIPLNEKISETQLEYRLTGMRTNDIITLKEKKIENVRISHNSICKKERERKKKYVYIMLQETA